VAEKAFALAIAGSGLVAFALTVALIQQARQARPPGHPATLRLYKTLVATNCCAACCLRCCGRDRRLWEYTSRS